MSSGPGDALVILYEDNHCLAIAKPAGALTTGYDGSEEPLDRQLKHYLKAKYDKPGNVFLGVVHRLDRLTSGVLLYARTSKAAARLSAQFREGKVAKTYWAIVEGMVAPPNATWEDWLAANAGEGKVRVAAPGDPGVRRARLRYELKSAAHGLCWVEIRPETGRKHQIRVQFAQRGHPVFGDVKYGSRHRFGQAVALHARSLTFEHPTRHARVTLTAELPASWSRFAALLGDVQNVGTGEKKNGRHRLAAPDGR